MKENLIKILISAIFFTIAIFIDITWLKIGLFLISYIVVAYEVLLEAVENIKEGEIFGEEFAKTVPVQTNESFIYDETTNTYTATEITLDEKEDSFLLNTITKNEEGYSVEVIEYLADYSEENSVIIKNLNEEEIGRVGVDDSVTNMQEIVKQYADRFTKKELTIKQEGENLIIKKVETIS